MKPEEIIIDQLFKEYKKKGYVTENEIYDLCETYDLSFILTDYVGNQLLAKGVMISDGIPKQASQSIDSEVADYSQTDYEELYQKLLKECPELSSIVECARQVPPPQMGEAKELFIQFRSGNHHARDILIQKYIRVALRFAWNYKNKTTIPVEDLFSECMIGIMKAVETYDPFSNIAFANYVVRWMWQTIERFISDYERIIRYPAYVVDRINTVKKLELKLQTLPDNEASALISEELDVSLNEAAWYYDQLNSEPISSIEQMLEENGEISTYESLYLSQTIDDLADEISLKADIRSAIDKLSEKERKVIILRYGLYNYPILSLEEIGSKMSVTRERIRQIEAKAIRKIKVFLQVKRKYDISISEPTKKETVVYQSPFTFIDLHDRNKALDNSSKFKYMDSNGEIYYTNKLGKIVANIKTKVFGDPRCYNRKHLSNPVYFTDELSAISAGFKPCPYCMKELFDAWNGR